MKEEKNTYTSKEKKISRNVGIETSAIIDEKVKKGEITKKKADKLNDTLVDATIIQTGHYKYPEGPKAKAEMQELTAKLDREYPYFGKGGWIDFKSKRAINKIKKELEKKGDTYSIQFDPDGSRFGLKGGGRYRITSGEHLSTTYAKGGKIYKIKNRRKFEKWYDEVSGWGGIDGDKWFMDDGIKIYGFTDDEIRAEKEGKEVYIRDDIYEKYSNPDDADFKLDTKNLYAKGGKVLTTLTLKDFQGAKDHEEIYDKVKDRNGYGSVYEYEEKLTENQNRQNKWFTGSSF